MSSTHAIFGIVGPAAPGELEAMSRSLGHRGEHDATWSLSPNLHLGARGASRQGVEDMAGSSFVVCGPLVGLRPAGDAGRSGPGSSSSAGRGVSVASMSELLSGRGVEGLHRIRGPWSAAIARRDDHLVLARDPSAMEALYFTSCGDRLLFASEYKAFLAVDGFRAVPDRDAIQYLHGRNYTPHGRTCFDGVYEVPVGGRVEVRPGRLTCDFQSRGPGDLDDRPEDDIVDDVRRRFLEAIRARLPSDPGEPVGVLLSAGLDSASVLAGIRAVDPGRPVHTFTAGWGRGDPEMEAARGSAAELGSEHHEVVMRPSDLAEILPRAVWWLEEPVGREDIPLCWVAVRAASNHVDTLFSGFGPDPLFAGMQRHLLLHLMNRFPPLRGPLSGLWWYSQHAVMPDDTVGSWVVHAYYRNDLWLPPRVVGAGEPDIKPPPFGSSVRLTDLLSREDPTHARVGALHRAHGLEPTAPWKDSSLIELAARLPDRMKIRGTRQKYVCRKACEKLLPATIRKRRKTLHRLDYGAELSGVLDAIAAELLPEDQVRGRGLFDPVDVAELRDLEPDETYSEERAQRLWTVLLTEIWARTFVDADGSQPIELRDLGSAHIREPTP